MHRNVVMRGVGALLLVVAVSWLSVGASAATGALLPRSLIGTWWKAIPATTRERNHVSDQPAGRYAFEIIASAKCC